MSNHIEDSPMTSGVMAVDPTPKWKRAWRWILQAYWKHSEMQPPEDVCLIPQRIHTNAGKVFKTVPVYAKDAITCEVSISVSLLDILRLLLGCKLQVNSRIYCEKPPGFLKTETTAFATFD